MNLDEFEHIKDPLKESVTICGYETDLSDTLSRAFYLGLRGVAYCPICCAEAIQTLSTMISNNTVSTDDVS